MSARHQPGSRVEIDATGRSATARRWVAPRRVARTLGFAPLATALGVAGCASAFGIDEPLLDPCARARCVDASLTVPTPDASSAGVADTGATPPNDAGAGDGPTDTGASADRASPEVVLCGGGGFPLSACAGATPTCCELVDGGATEYACSTSPAACNGYPISCSSSDDCTAANEADGGDAGKVCCHFDSNMVCAPASHCVPSHSGVLVCDPDAGGCPVGTACMQIPKKAYYGCQ